MNPKIEYQELSQEYFFKEGCYILEISNSEDDEYLSIARARVEPNQTTAWHQLIQTTERYTIIEGEGEVEVGNVPPTTVRVGDVVIIPPLTRQRIRNTGDSDLIFLALCSPRFKIQNYQALE